MVQSHQHEIFLHPLDAGRTSVALALEHIPNELDTDLAAEILHSNKFGIEDSHRFNAREYNILG